MTPPQSVKLCRRGFEFTFNACPYDGIKLFTVRF